MSQMPSFLKIGNKPNVALAVNEPYRLQDYKPLMVQGVSFLSDRAGVGHRWR